MEEKEPSPLVGSWNLWFAEFWWKGALPAPARDSACFPPGLKTRISLSQLYGSSSAVSLICQAVCHMSMTRVLFCRDLLILQKLYLRFGDNVRRRRSPSLQKKHLLSNLCLPVCISGVSWRRLSAVAASAGPDSPELPHAHLLSPPQTHQPEPGFLSPCGCHVSIAVLLHVLVAVWCDANVPSVLSQRR